MNKRRCTIKDVAELAGVAVSTASLVLNNKGYVSNELRKKVQSAVEQLGYVPNRTARSLINKATGNIGFVISEEHFSTAEPFYTRVFLGTEFEARQWDSYVLLTTVPNKFHSSHIPRFISERNVDGVIFAGKISEAYAAAVVAESLPAVVVDFEFKKVRIPAINIDNVRGTSLAVEHLSKLGHKKIAFIAGDIAHPSIKLRLDGYTRAIKRLGLEQSDGLMSVEAAGTGMYDGYISAKKLLDASVEFSSVVACNDAVAIGAIRAFREHGMKVPEDCSIVGFDDIELCEHVDPRLTSISVPKEDLGATAMRVLTRLIKDNEQPISSVLIEPSLVARQSTMAYLESGAD